MKKNARTKAASGALEHLLGLVDEGYDAKAWHGPNLRAALRRVSAAQAAWRPGTGRHNIWELAVHAAYWKYAVRRRLAGGKRGAFALKGSNWFSRPDEPNEEAWRQDLRLLQEEHDRLREAVAALDPSRLDQRSPGSRYTPSRLAAGAAFHDVYHAGQIQVLKRLCPLTR